MDIKEKINERLNTYSVTLAPVKPYSEDDLLSCDVTELTCIVKAESFVNACVYAQAYFSEKLDCDMVIESGFSYMKHDEKQAEENQAFLEVEVGKSGPEPGEME